MNSKKNQIILASGSPRRKFFFEKMQLNFIVKVIPVKEKYPPGLNGIETARHIAHKKSEAFFEKIKKNQLVITADTIVWHKNKPLGSFGDFACFSFHSSHEVITAVCFLTKEKIEIIHEVSTVTFGQVSENEINDYIKTGSPFDKAGSYGIQDPFGIRNIVSINGSYTNIIGLPVAQVFKKIKEIIIEN